MVEKTDIIDRGKLRFRPRARLLHLLGHELITDEAIALIELVKNSHDADATCVDVKLIDVTDQKRGKIEVLDDGYGMTLEIVKKAWMEPARDNKKDDKGGRARTKRFNRLPLGEKGIGRFSVDKLGLKLELITRFCRFNDKQEISDLSDQEVVLIIEGRKFTEESYLDQMECEWITRRPEVFKGDSHGTLLKISALRAKWSLELIEKVRLGLARLSSPLSEAKDFEIQFFSNEFPELSAKIENPLLKIAPWLLDATIDDNGIMHYTMKGHEPEMIEKGSKDLRKGSERFSAKIGRKKEYRKPVCGPFKFKLYAFEREKRKWKKFGMDKAKIELLNDLMGVNIYRDGFRIMPYGEKGNDWLLFDKRRIQSPGRRLGNDRVIGYIEISRDSNPYLKDKTNREGLIEEGNAFQDLTHLAMNASDMLGLFRYKFEPKKKRSKAKAEEAKEDIETGTRDVEESSRMVQTKLDSADEKIKTSNLDGAKSDFEEAKKEAASSEKATDKIKEGATKLLEELRESDEQIDNLISLSGIGMTAERMTHELSKAAGYAKKMLKDTLKRLESGKADIVVVKRNLTSIIAQLDIIIDHIRQMEPLYYSRRRYTEKLNVGEIARDMIKFYKGSIRDLGIVAEVKEESKLYIEMNRGHLLQIFNNLFDNSFFWLEYEPTEGKPRITIKISGKNERTMIFADNGPGVEKFVEDHIFDPFVSTKPDGRGFGLYIIEDILQNYKAEIELISEGKILKGANFKITFPEVN